MAQTAKDLLDQLRSDSTGGQRGRCKWGVWWDQLDNPVLKEAITAAAADEQVSGAAIVRLALKHGYEGGETIAKNHLSASVACACNKKGNK